MALKNFRANDFKKDKDNVEITQSKRDKVPTFVEPVQEPTSTPIVSQGSSPDDVPSGTVPEILTWVGDDKDRAQKALDAETENEKPRKGLVSQLNDILAG